jgi:hypothetical protein
MIYRDRDEYEEKEASVPEEAISELMDGDEDDLETPVVPPDVEEDDKWE